MRGTRHLRARTEDLQMFKEWSRLLGVSQPELFHKVLRSDKINLKGRIFEEYQLKDKDIRRKLGYA
jgi:hypothetical protein